MQNGGFWITVLAIPLFPIENGLPGKHFLFNLFTTVNDMKRDALNGATLRPVMFLKQ
jgi:hypothetical protein